MTREVKIIGLDSANEWKKTGFSFIEKVNDNRYKNLTHFESCRSWMCDALFNMKTGCTKALHTEFTFDYKKGPIYIGMSFSDVKHKNTFLSRINLLHEKEDKAKVKRSEVITSTKKGQELMLIIKGDRYWKDSCWKMMLYTYYLKITSYLDNSHEYYQAALSPYEDKLLSRVKCRKEIFDPSVFNIKTGSGRHSYEGFVSICSGYNIPMAKYLGLTGKAIGK